MNCISQRIIWNYRTRFTFSGAPEDIGNSCGSASGPEDAQYINGVGLNMDGGHQTVCTCLRLISPARSRS